MSLEGSLRFLSPQVGEIAFHFPPDSLSLFCVWPGRLSVKCLMSPSAKISYMGFVYSTKTEVPSEFIPYIDINTIYCIGYITLLNVCLNFYH